MTGSATRARKYDAKVIGDVAKSRLDHYRIVQAGAFNKAVKGQVRIERLVKQILSNNTIMVSLNHFYMNFGKKIDKIRRTYTGPTAQLEVCIEFEKWSSRGLDDTTLDEIVVALGFENCYVAPPVCAWDWKRKLTFSGNVATTNLDDFPVLVHLTVANFDFNKAHAQGHDIRFMDSDTCPSDGTPLKHEIELWDKPGNNAWVWVKVPRIDANSAVDFIYMFYGNVGAPDGQDVPNTWEAGYEAVWHKLGDGTANMPDSTVNANNGTKKAIGEPANLAAGHIDGCQNYDGDDYITLPTMWGNTPQSYEVLEAWVYVGDLSYQQAFYQIHGNRIYLDVGATSGKFRFVGHDGGYKIIESIGTYNTNTWYHVVGILRNNNNVELFVDGASQGTTNIGAQGSQALTWYMGAQAPGSITLTGRMDECRISDVTRSPDWIMATYRSGAELLITYGAEQPA